MSDLRSLADTATFFSVSQPTLRRWIDAGCPVAEKGSNGVAYKLDLRAVAAWRSDQREAEDAAATARAEHDAQLRLQLLGADALTVEVGAPALTPKQRADALAAEVARTKLAQLRRETVAVEPMKLMLAETLSLLKTRLRQIPDVIGPEVGLTEAQSARMADLIDDALADTADALENMTDAAVA